jgi:hypothetical protein
MSDRRKRFQLSFREQARHHLRDQAALQWKLIAIDRYARRNRQTGFVDNRSRKQVPDQPAKQEHRQRAPHATIALAVEKARGDHFEEGTRRSKVEETIGAASREHVCATLDEPPPVVAENGSQPDLLGQDNSRGCGRKSPGIENCKLPGYLRPFNLQSWNYRFSSSIFAIFNFQFSIFNFQFLQFQFFLLVIK